MNLTLSDYQLRLPTFEGALDVLLSLIERERLDISDLSLVQVTDGFLVYIDELTDPPPALLAEFAGIASRLLVLKSRALLPRPLEAEEEPDLDDLAAQLREYQRAKQAADMLRSRHESGARTFCRNRTMLGIPARALLVAPPVGHLSRALRRTLARSRPAPQVAALTPLVSISEMLVRFRERLCLRRNWRFYDLVGVQDRSETIAGFIALLALWRRGEINVSQSNVFGEIHVESSDRLAIADVADD